MTILTISHNVFLNSEERHKLAVGEAVETTGVSLPVWLHKGKSSEPASEVFCKYYLTNSGDENNVKFITDGYKIDLPQKYRNWEPPKLSDEVWRGFSKKEKEKWYDNNFPDKVVSGKNLLDLTEGGSEYLHFREHNKIFQNNEAMEIIHYITILDIKTFDASSTIFQAEGHSHSN